MGASSTIVLGAAPSGCPLGSAWISVYLDGIADATAIIANIVGHGSCNIAINSTKLGERLAGHVWQGWRWRQAAGGLPEVHLLMQVWQGACQQLQ